MSLNLTISTLGRFWQALFRGHQDLKQSSFPLQTAEMIIIRLIHLSNVVITFLFYIYLSRIMGANNFGFYFFIITLITTLAIFSKNGLDLLVIRFIPKYIVENNMCAVPRADEAQ